MNAVEEFSLKNHLSLFNVRNFASPHKLIFMCTQFIAMKIYFFMKSIFSLKSDAEEEKLLLMRGFSEGLNVVLWMILPYNIFIIS